MPEADIGADRGFHPEIAPPTSDRTEALTFSDPRLSVAFA